MALRGPLRYESAPHGAARAKPASSRSRSRSSNDCCDHHLSKSTRRVQGKRGEEVCSFSLIPGEDGRRARPESFRSSSMKTRTMGEEGDKQGGGGSETKGDRGGENSKILKYP